jgi:hypothetical protein
LAGDKNELDGERSMGTKKVAGGQAGGQQRSRITAFLDFRYHQDKKETREKISERWTLRTTAGRSTKAATKEP